MKNTYKSLIQKNSKFLIVVFAIGMISSCTKDAAENNPIKENVDITISDFSSEIKENPAENTVLGSIDFVSEIDNLKFSLTEEKPEGALQLDATSAKLTIRDSSLFDFEINPVISAKVVATDGENSQSGNISIQLVDEYEEYFDVAHFSTSVKENQTAKELGMIEASSNVGELSYKLISSEPEGAVHLDSITGALELADVNILNYELYTQLTAVVEVSNTEEVIESEVTVDIEDVQEEGLKKFVIDGVEYPVDRVVMRYEPKATTAYYHHKLWNFTFLPESLVGNGSASTLTGFGDYMTISVFGITYDVIDEDTYYQGISSAPDNNFTYRRVYKKYFNDITDEFTIDTIYIKDGVSRVKRTLISETTYTFEIDYYYTLSNGTVISGTYHGEGIDISE